MFQALPQLKGEVVVSSAFETTLNAHTKLLFSFIAGCLSQRRPILNYFETYSMDFEIVNKIFNDIDDFAVDKSVFYRKSLC